MLTKAPSKCPFHAASAEYSFVFKKAPQQNFLVKLASTPSELLARIGPKSLKNAWLVATQNDTTKMFERAWQKKQEK